MYEAEVGRLLLPHLVDRGCTVYQEVTIGGCRADFVAQQPCGKLHIIELKTSLSMEVLQQGEHWVRCGYAHMCSVAVPSSRAGRSLACRVAEWLGVGVMYMGTSLQIKVNPLVVRRPAQLAKTLAALVNHRDTIVAGSPSGGEWTPFRSTCLQLAAFVREHPGCSLKTALTGIRHHYASDASARGALVHWLKKSKIAGVEMRRDGRQLVLHPSRAS